MTFRSSALGLALGLALYVHACSSGLGPEHLLSKLQIVSLSQPFTNCSTPNRLLSKKGDLMIIY